MRKTCSISILILFFSTHSLSAEGRFKPWGSDMRVGDETKKIIKGADGTRGKLRRAGIINRRVRPVYNGVQGGAYFMIRFFQVVISPQDGANCRFTPTCSAYGKHAVEKHGALLGAIMAGERLIRCNPYNRPGYDRVPDKVFTGK
jgi:putative membrane protein insertion efficiency factor